MLFIKRCHGFKDSYGHIWKPTKKKKRKCYPDKQPGFHKDQGSLMCSELQNSTAPVAALVPIKLILWMSNWSLINIKSVIFLIVIHYIFSKLITLRIKTNLFKPLIRKYYKNEQCLSFTENSCNINYTIEHRSFINQKGCFQIRRL